MQFSQLLGLIRSNRGAIIAPVARIGLLPTIWANVGPRAEA